MSVFLLSQQRRRRVAVGVGGGVGGQFVHLAELPRSTPAFTYSPPTGGVLHQPPDAAALAALLAAPDTTLQLGDIVELAAGVQYTSVGQPQQIFPNVTAQRPGSNAAKIYVRTSALANLPLPGTRVSSAVTVAGAAAAKAEMPLFRQINSGGVPALLFATRAHGYVFSGIAADAGNVTVTSRVVEVGSPGAPPIDHVMDIVFDRCYMAVETAANNGVRPLYILAAGTGIIVRDSWLFCELGDTSDNQAILIGRNNSGPGLIENNFLAARSENILFGGDNPGPDGALIPSDYTIRRNYMYKNVAWTGQKNLVELKCGVRILVEDNFGEIHIGDGQQYAINLKSVNQPGTDNLVQVADVVIRYNRWKDLRGCFIFSDGQAVSGGTFVPAARLTLLHNLFEGHQFFGTQPVARLANTNGVAVWNNTFISDTVPLSTAVSLAVTGLLMTDFSWRDNIFHRAEFGVKGDGITEGTTSLNAATTGGFEFVGNTIITTGGTYPAGQTRPVDIAAVGFENPATRDYRLASSSAVKGTGHAGGDPGADVVAVLRSNTTL